MRGIANSPAAHQRKKQGGATARRIDWGREPIREMAGGIDLDERGLPFRLAAGAPGFRRFATRIVVTLNGAEVRRCVAFDVNEGFVRVQREDREGRIFLEHGKVAEQVKRGRVRVRWK